VLVVQTLKWKANDNPEQPPAQLLLTELGGVPDAVLSQLLDQVALAQTIRRMRRRDLLANPKKLSALGDVPDRFQKTLMDENFLIYDSGTPDTAEESDSEDE